MVSKHHFLRWARCSFLHHLVFLIVSYQSKSYQHQQHQHSISTLRNLNLSPGVLHALHFNRDSSHFGSPLLLCWSPHDAGNKHKNTKTQKQKTQKHKNKNTNTLSYSSSPSLIGSWCWYGDKHKPSLRNLEYRTYVYVNTMILIIKKNKVSGLLSYLNSRLGHLYSPLKIRFLKYSVFFKYSLLSNAGCIPKVQCFCGFWSNRTLLYFPLSVRPPFVRPFVTGVTYQLFSIFWRFIPWKPYIFWMHII